MDLSIDDCDARIFRYFQDFVKVVEDNGLQQLIGKTDPSFPGYRDRMKARCKLLMENLQPAVLREQIERLVDLERRDCRTGDVARFDLILENAKAQHRECPRCCHFPSCQEPSQQVAEAASYDDGSPHEVRCSGRDASDEGCQASCRWMPGVRWCPLAEGVPYGYGRAAKGGFG
ncbi:hypothetical protein PPTG_24870 [Phytophthora nicotianae INRA-310]|uniref:Uncharacterized protein n=1 Tax=Phytophthora nicotianae (strain INRA-310) TaxID=761204 RepID=W2PBR7_PHYN3|nr:hypothetical protein PPTG_24870 [Phytophthora nicotianae INRA-310]ETM97673.1 hypothetical protein PPTG_24870 [Phytophthora nicotianae INRA-310]